MSNQENVQNESDEIEVIPLKERTIFQVKLMQKMLGPDFVNKSRQERTDTEITWTENFAKMVSDIIDHAEHKEIRDLIMSNRYEEAVDMIIPVIKNNNNLL